MQTSVNAGSTYIETADTGDLGKTWGGRNGNVSND